MVDLTSDKIRTDVIRSNFFNEDKLFFEKLNITRKSYTSPLGLHIYLRELSDGYYYAKKKAEDKICNEIVGRYLCNKIGLETTDLELLLDEDKLKIVTPNYRKQNLKYQCQKDDADKLFRHQYDIRRLSILPKAYQKEQFKLISIDMMMEQWDRSGKNMEEVVIDGKLHLTPVIDFENSFLYNKYFIYDNPYVSIPKDVENIDMFLNDFPEAYKYFLEIFDIEVDELIECIESNYPIKVDNEVKEEYNRTISKNQKILKAIS